MMPAAGVEEKRLEFNMTAQKSVGLFKYYIYSFYVPAPPPSSA
jgi:hypothetical protein